jgi:hypothetical protein
LSYIDTLINYCQQAKSAYPTKEFVLNDIDDLKKVNNSIYIIEQTSGDIEQTFEDMKRYKATKERACPAINNPSPVMYVGSSTSSVKNRIKQHLGEGNKSTYSLHLSKWFEGKFRITIKEYDVPREVLQIIEDDISDRLNPAFGKKGGNNK